MSFNQLSGLQFVDDNTDPLPQVGERESELPSYTPQFLKTARHPVICLFHLVFKVAVYINKVVICTLIAFLFGSIIFGGFHGDYIFSFVTTTVLLSIDFWFVKNISGRKLVFMRWWNLVKNDGSNEWYFEKFKDDENINLTDRTVFWTALYIYPLVWILFFVIYFIKLNFEWVLLALMGVFVSGSNLIGYYKCYKDFQGSSKPWFVTTIIQSMIGKIF